MSFLTTVHKNHDSWLAALSGKSTVCQAEAVICNWQAIQYLGNTEVTFSLLKIRQLLNINPRTILIPLKISLLLCVCNLYNRKGT